MSTLRRWKFFPYQNIKPTIFSNINDWNLGLALKGYPTVLWAINKLRASIYSVITCGKRFFIKASYDGPYRMPSCLNGKFSPPPIKVQASIFQDPRDLLDQCEADQCSLFVYKRVRREHLGRKPQAVGEGPRPLLRWLPRHSFISLHIVPVATDIVLILYGTWGVIGEALYIQSGL